MKGAHVTRIKTPRELVSGVLLHYQHPDTFCTDCGMGYWELVDMAADTCVLWTSQECMKDYVTCEECCASLGFRGLEEAEL